MQYRRRGPFAAMVALLAAVGFVTVGCGENRVSVSEVKGTAPEETGAVKPTAEQDAAKRQGEKQGEELQAVQAAERTGQ